MNLRVVLIQGPPAHLAEESLDHIVGPRVGVEQQVAPHGEAEVALGLTGAADAGGMEDLDHRFVFLAPPQVRQRSRGPNGVQTERNEPNSVLLYTA